MKLIKIFHISQTNKKLKLFTWNCIYKYIYMWWKEGRSVGRMVIFCVPNMPNILDSYIFYVHTKNCCSLQLQMLLLLLLLLSLLLLLLLHITKQCNAMWYVFFRFRFIFRFTSPHPRKFRYTNVTINIYEVNEKFLKLHFLPVDHPPFTSYYFFTFVSFFNTNIFHKM